MYVADRFISNILQEKLWKGPVLNIFYIVYFFLNHAYKQTCYFTVYAMMLCFHVKLTDGLAVFSSVFPVSESLMPAGRHAVILASMPNSHYEILLKGQCGKNNIVFFFFNKTFLH